MQLQREFAALGAGGGQPFWRKVREQQARAALAAGRPSRCRQCRSSLRRAWPARRRPARRRHIRAARLAPQLDRGFGAVPSLAATGRHACRAARAIARCFDWLTLSGRPNSSATMRKAVGGRRLATRNRPGPTARCLALDMALAVQARWRSAAAKSSCCTSSMSPMQRESRIELAGRDVGQEQLAHAQGHPHSSSRSCGEEARLGLSRRGAAPSLAAAAADWRGSQDCQIGPSPSTSRRSSLSLSSDNLDQAALAALGAARRRGTWCRSARRSHRRD